MLLSIVKFIPLMVFALLVIVFKLDLLIAAPLATFTAAAVYMITKRARFATAFEHALDAARKIVLIFFILCLPTAWPSVSWPPAWAPRSSSWL